MTLRQTTLRQLLKSTHLLPTRRLMLLFLLTAPFVAASGAIPALWFLVLVLVLGTAGLIVADIRASSHAPDFEVVRLNDDRLSIGINNHIEIRVRNRAHRAVNIQVRDEPPALFTTDAGKATLSAHLPGNDQTTLVYTVRPPRRGDYAFGNLNLRWTSARGLLVFQTTFPARAPVKVYPNLHQVRQYESLVRRGRLMQLGVRATRQFGEGSEFEQLRDYVPDDDYRRICWKATARHNKPITIEYQVERSQNVLFMIDLSRQMITHGSPSLLSRIDHVVNAVLLLGYIAASKGDRVGLLTFADEVQCYMSPRPGRGQLYRMMEVLYGVQAQPVDADYARALGYLRAQRQRRSLIILFTEPGSTEAAQTLIGNLGAFYPHHLPLCIMFNDPSALTAARRTPVDTRTVYERAVAEQQIDERQIWLDTLKRRGISTLDVPPTGLKTAVINKYLEIKGRSRI